MFAFFKLFFEISSHSLLFSSVFFICIPNDTFVNVIFVYALYSLAEHLFTAWNGDNCLLLLISRYRLCVVLQQWYTVQYAVLCTGEKIFWPLWLYEKACLCVSFHCVNCIFELFHVQIRCNKASGEFITLKLTHCFVLVILHFRSHKHSYGSSCSFYPKPKSVKCILIYSNHTLSLKLLHSSN